MRLIGVYARGGNPEPNYSYSLATGRLSSGSRPVATPWSPSRRTISRNSQWGPTKFVQWHTKGRRAQKGKRTVSLRRANRRPRVRLKVNQNLSKTSLRGRRPRVSDPPGVSSESIPNAPRAPKTRWPTAIKTFLSNVLQRALLNDVFWRNVRRLLRYLFSLLSCWHCLEIREKISLSIVGWVACLCFLREYVRACVQICPIPQCVHCCQFNALSRDLLRCKRANVWAGLEYFFFQNFLAQKLHVITWNLRMLQKEYENTTSKCFRNRFDNSFSSSVATKRRSLHLAFHRKKDLSFHIKTKDFLFTSINTFIHKFNICR